MQELIDFTLSNASKVETKIQDLMLLVGIYGKALLKNPTNIVSLKIGLSGIVYRAFHDSQSNIVTLNEKQGVVVNLKGYTTVIASTEDIFSVEELPGYSPGDVFVSLKMCNDFASEIENLNSITIIGFLNGIESMPAELAGEFLATDSTLIICDNVFEAIMKDDIIYENQCKIFSNFLQIRDVLNAFWQKINGRGTQIHVREKKIGEIIERNIKYLDQTAHKIFMHLMNEEDIVKFTSKGGKRPLPVCNFHNYLFLMCYYLENFYQNTYEQLLKQNSAFYDNQFKLMRSQCFFFSSFDHSFTIKNDPIRRLAMGGVLSSIGRGENSHFKTSVLGTVLAPKYIPDSFIVDNGKLKAVYISQVEGFNPDCVGNLIKSEMLRHVLKKNFDSDVITKFVSLQDFTQDPYFYRTFNFKFNSDENYLHAICHNIMVTKTQFFPATDLVLKRENIQREKKHSLDLKIIKENLQNLYFEEIIKLWSQKDFLNLMDHIDEMIVILNKSIGDFDKEQYLVKIKQLYFLTSTLNKKLEVKSENSDYSLSEKNKKNLSDCLLMIKNFLENEEAKEENQNKKQFDIFGKRVVTDCFSFSENRKLNHGKNANLANNSEFLLAKGSSHPLLNNEENWKFELLNYKLFSNGEYFIMEDIKKHFENDLPQTQYLKNSNKLIMTDFTTNARFIIPSVKKRSIKKSVGVSMNWDKLVYKTNSNQKNDALYLDELVYKNHDSLEREFTENESFKIGMMNMLWDMKLSSNPAEDITKIFNCDFWKNIPSKNNLKAEKESVEFDVVSYNNALYNSEFKESYYSIKFDHLRTKNQEIEKWQYFVKVKIPDIYDKTKEETTKKEIFKFWEFAKRKYANMLKEYKNTVVKKDSYFKNANIKDFERKVVCDTEKVYSRDQKEIPLENRLLQNDEDVRLFAQNNLFKSYVYLQNKSNALEGELYEMWMNKIENDIFDDFIKLNNDIWEMPIESVFSEKDYETFDEVFPHMKIRNFKHFQISDLFIYMNLMINPWFIDIIEKVKFAKSIQIDNSLICPKSVLSLEGPAINNISKFMSLYIDNYMNLISIGLKNDEAQTVKELWKLGKENERNLIWTKPDLESFDDLLNDMPHLVNPLEGIRHWIQRKEKESKIRNSTYMHQISELTLSDKKLTPYFKNIKNKKLEEISQRLFNKKYDEIKNFELTKLVDHIIERVYLIKRNMPLNFFEIIHFILNHPQLHHADYINIFEIFSLFKIDVNDLAFDQLLVEYPVVFNDSCMISNKYQKFTVEELLALTDMVDCDSNKIYELN